MQNQIEETNFDSAGVALTGIAFSEDSGDPSAQLQRQDNYSPHRHDGNASRIAPTPFLPLLP